MSFNLADTKNLFSKITFKRAWNAIQVIASFYLSKWTKKTVHWGNPISIAIEPTTACNLGCPECPSGLKQFTRPTGNLSIDFFRNTINQLANTLGYVTFYFQGEPYINSQFLEMVNYASKKGIYTATSTNAHFLNDENAQKTIESGLDRLIISIDGTTQETYESYRINGKLDQVIEGAKNMVKWKKKLDSSTPHIIFQFLVVQPNEHQLEDVQRLAKEIGIDEVRFKTAQLYDFENGNPLMPTIDKYSRYKKLKDGSYTIKNYLLNHCWRLWNSCVITWDGLIVPCCFDKDAQHQLGDIKKSSFQEVWKGKPYQNFRSSILRSRSEIEICKNCSEGTKVWA